ncbi:MAG: CDP-diacylglycerol--serine O-phosphatidyltransferase [Bacteroidales bacterium]|nr:CDP-diacylglycerol--serine O-phosphatidyltransferase [Bacteroidales bacterium]
MFAIKKHIPNAITSLNLLCGTVALVFAFKGRFDIAFPLMLLASVFDFCDGLAARLLHAYSPMGKELDSLADMVSFGVLPAVMLYKLMLTCNFGENPLSLVCLLLAVFSGLRLAKFNVDERQTESFLGLPTPASALLCGSLCYFVAYSPASFLAFWCAGQIFLPLLTAALCALLVCELPMFSMKLGTGSADKTLKWKRIIFAVLVVLVVIFTFATGQNWSLAVFLSFTLYIVKNLVYAIFRI